MIYHSLHLKVLGLKAILWNCELISNYSFLRKDTDYPLRQLFIGTWCTIGVIPIISIVATAKPRIFGTVLIPCKNCLLSLKRVIWSLIRFLYHDPWFDWMYYWKLEGFSQLLENRYSSYKPSRSNPMMKESISSFQAP